MSRKTAGSEGYYFFFIDHESPNDIPFKMTSEKFKSMFSIQFNFLSSKKILP